MPNSEISAAELTAQFRKEKVKRVKLAFADIDGVHRGKYIALDKFSSIANDEAGFCDCILGWDVNDQLYDNAEFTGWHTAFPDAKYRLDLDSEIRLQEEANTPFFIADFVVEDQLHPICPRSRLKEVIHRAHKLGYAAKMAFEYEFFIFKESPQSAMEKGYQNLIPLSPGNFGYSALRTFAQSDLFNEFMDYCLDHDFALEGLHCETGPGVWEGAIAVDDCLQADEQKGSHDEKVLVKPRSLAQPPGNPDEHEEEAGYDSKRADQPQLFPDYGKNEIRVSLGQKMHLLAPHAQAYPVHPANAKGQHYLISIGHYRVGELYTYLVDQK